MLCSSRRKRKSTIKEWKYDSVYRVNTNRLYQKDIPEGSRALITVELYRDYATNWGIGISGGTDRGYKPFISCIRAGSVADRSDSLLVGDRILEVNGIRVGALTHNEILNLLKNAGEKIVLSLAYNLNDLRFTTVRNCVLKTFELKVDKEERSLGFVVRGGGPYEHRSAPPTIVHIRPGGPADRDGRLRIGDRLTSINGIDVRQHSLNSVQDLLKKATGTMHLQIQYDALVIDSMKNNCRPLLLQIEKPPGSDLGLKLQPVDEGKGSSWKSFRISDVVAGTIADRCGAFSVGDELLSVDGIALQLSTPAEVQQLLKGGAKSKITVEIQPKKGLDDGKALVKSPRPIRAGSSAKPGRVELQHSASGYTEIVKDKGKTATDSGLGSCSTSPGSVAASISGLPYGQICRSEAMEVVLNCGFRGGYGLVFHRYHMLAECENAPLFVSYIEKGSPAEKCGLLQVGDRALSLNDWCTELGTADEANQMVKQMSGPLTLTIEFDVIESVLPNCGVFTVKLAKRNQHLGLLIRGPVSYGKGEPVVVSDVEIGSVAYRCGTVQPGDQLLAIDNIPLDTCTVEEAIRLLQRSSDVVKLRVKKYCSSCEGADTSPHTVVYSIEVNRKGSPLGISIASTEDHVLVSQLTPGGLAEKTGAIHVGDRLMAINNISLERQPLQEVLRLLQQAGDMVVLKIGRNLQDRVRAAQLPGYSPDCGYHRISNEKLCTPVQSVDSAVESLDECPIGDHFPHIVAKTSNSSLASTNAEVMAHEGHRLRNALESMKMISELSDTGQTKEGCKRISQGDPSLSEWNKVLEALESIGEPETLQKLEHTILSGRVPCINTSSNIPIPPPPLPKVGIPSQQPKYAMNTIRKRPVCQLSRVSYSSATSQSKEADRGLLSVKCTGSSSHHVNAEAKDPSAAPQYEHATYAPTTAVMSSFGQHIIDGSREASTMSSVTTNTVLTVNTSGSTETKPPRVYELHRVTLEKDMDNNDFGFSISDGVEEKGVFVHELRPSGPADRSGNIYPFDRIMKVNEVNVQEIDCMLTAPLLASCGNQVELLLRRVTSANRTIRDNKCSCRNSTD